MMASQHAHLCGSPWQLAIADPLLWCLCCLNLMRPESLYGVMHAQQHAQQAGSRGAKPLKGSAQGKQVTPAVPFGSIPSWSTSSQLSRAAVCARALDVILWPCNPDGTDGTEHSPTTSALLPELQQYCCLAYIQSSGASCVQTLEACLHATIKHAP